MASSSSNVEEWEALAQESLYELGTVRAMAVVL
jgi:hypothetical protein